MTNIFNIHPLHDYTLGTKDDYRICSSAHSTASLGASFAAPLTQLQADLNNLEGSVDELQNYFREVCFSSSTCQHSFAPQHLAVPLHPATTNPQLRATPQPMYIKTGISEPGFIWFFSTNLVVTTSGT